MRENVTVHWGVGLNKKTVARFYYPKDSADLRLMIGAGWWCIACCAALCVLCCAALRCAMLCCGWNGMAACFEVAPQQHPAPRHLPIPTPPPALPAGDELRLRHPCVRVGCPPWVGVGSVCRLDDALEEVAIELRGKEKGQGNAPTDVTTGFVGACGV